jgi:hypothetical protein
VVPAPVGRPPIPGPRKPAEHTNGGGSTRGRGRIEECKRSEWGVPFRAAVSWAYSEPFESKRAWRCMDSERLTQDFSLGCSFLGEADTHGARGLSVRQASRFNTKYRVSACFIFIMGCVKKIHAYF